MAPRLVAFGFSGSSISFGIILVAILNSIEGPCLKYSYKEISAAFSMWSYPSCALASAVAATGRADVVHGKNSVVAIVVVLGKESRDTSTLGTAMVDQLLEETLDLFARKTAGSLEKSAETTTALGLPAGNLLSVLVPAVVIKPTSLASEPS